MKASANDKGSTLRGLSSKADAVIGHLIDLKQEAREHTRLLKSIDTALRTGLKVGGSISNEDAEWLKRAMRNGASRPDVR